MEHLKAFIKNPKRMGFPMPTPDKDTDLLVEQIEQEHRYIVELGTGEGNVTKKILREMSLEAKLLSIEKNKRLYSHAKEKIKDKRLYLINGDAKNIEIYIVLHKFPKQVDCVISTLPLLLMLPKERKNIIKVCYNSLHPGGIFVQIQYAKLSKKGLEKQFSSVELKSYKDKAPFVYVCKK